jgi:predicted transcriptional regulator
MTDATRPVSVRVPEELYVKLKMLAAGADQPLSAVVVEALSAYAGLEVQRTVPDRLKAVERELESLRGKLQSLATN